MLETIAYSIAGGMLAVLSTARVELISWKFLRLAVIIPFALIVACAAWSMRTSPSTSWTNPVFYFGWATGFLALVLILMAPTGATQTGRFRVLSAIGGLLGITAASLCAVQVFSAPGSNAVASLPTNVFIVLGQLLGSWLLGSITLAWLLGHAYLTATAMTIAPLKHFSRMLSWSVFARVVFAAVSAAAAWYSIDAATPSVFIRLEQAWLIAVLRFGVGLVAVGVFAYMVRDCVRLRSTQSATGILYFGSVMAYVGELAALQLTREVGWPL